MKQQRDMDKENVLCSRGKQHNRSQEDDNVGKNAKNDNEISYNPKDIAEIPDERDGQQIQHEPITVPFGDCSSADNKNIDIEDEIVTTTNSENIPVVACKTGITGNDSIHEINGSVLAKNEQYYNDKDKDGEEILNKDEKSLVDTGMEKTKYPKTRKTEAPKELNPIAEEDGLKDTDCEISLVAQSNNNEVRKSSRESIEFDVKRPSTSSTCKSGQLTRRAQSGRRPASTIERTARYDLMFERRPYSAMDASTYKARKKKSLTPRRHSGDQFRFTKAELDWHLPRKSNFDCHDKALKDAGLESEEKLSMIEKRRQKIMEKLRKEKEARMKNKENLMEAKENAKKNETENTSSQNVTTDSSSVLDLKEEDEELTQSETVETVVETKKNTSVSFSSKKHTKSKRKGLHDDDEDDVRVDYQPLLAYLRYAKDNPDEFLSHQKSSIETQRFGQKASSRIQRMAEIMERKQRNMVAFSESVVVQAVKDIRPRVTDPGQWTIANKERNFMNTLGGMGSRKDMFPGGKQETHGQDSNLANEEHKSEYEKEKSKLDKWLKTVSTAQLNKAKELALKEVGEEDRYQTSWWSALQTCSYLRQKRTDGINEL